MIKLLKVLKLLTKSLRRNQMLKKVKQRKHWLKKVLLGIKKQIKVLHIIFYWPTLSLSQIILLKKQEERLKVKNSGISGLLETPSVSSAFFSKGRKVVKGFGAWQLEKG